MHLHRLPDPDGLDAAAVALRRQGYAEASVVYVAVAGTLRRAIAVREARARTVASAMGVTRLGQAKFGLSWAYFPVN